MDLDHDTKSAIDNLQAQITALKGFIIPMLVEWAKRDPAAVDRIFDTLPELAPPGTTPLNERLVLLQISFDQIRDCVSDAIAAGSAGGNEHQDNAAQPGSDVKREIPSQEGTMPRNPSIKRYTVKQLVDGKQVGFNFWLDTQDDPIRWDCRNEVARQMAEDILRETDPLQSE